LCFLGIRTFFAKPTARNGRVPEGGLRSAFLTTFVLTLTNPMTILSFVAVFAGLGLGSSPDFRAASVLVAGVFVGSALWWLVLSGGVALFQSRFSPAWMQVVNRVSGSVTFAFGIYSLATVWSL
jgi:threonine/homoserine/homoserine lactone efflux protein